MARDAILEGASRWRPVSGRARIKREENEYLRNEWNTAKRDKGFRENRKEKHSKSIKNSGYPVLWFPKQPPGVSWLHLSRGTWKHIFTLADTK